MTDNTVSPRRRVATTAPAPSLGHVHCLACTQPISLDDHPFDVLGAGERGYTCGVCGTTAVFYSAAWLDDRRRLNAVSP